MRLKLFFLLQWRNKITRSTNTWNFLIELENREKKLVRDTDINNCRPNRRECLSVKRKLLFFEGGQPTSRVTRDSYFSIYLVLQHKFKYCTIFYVIYGVILTLKNKMLKAIYNYSLSLAYLENSDTSP